MPQPPTSIYISVYYCVNNPVTNHRSSKLQAGTSLCLYETPVENDIRGVWRCLAVPSETLSSHEQMAACSLIGVTQNARNAVKRKTDKLSVRTFTFRSPRGTVCFRSSRLVPPHAFDTVRSRSTTRQSDCLIQRQHYLWPRGHLLTSTKSFCCTNDDNERHVCASVTVLVLILTSFTDLLKDVSDVSNTCHV